jgi:hypothetical protein
MSNRDADHIDPSGTRREQTPERETQGAEERDRNAERKNPEGVPDADGGDDADADSPPQPVYVIAFNRREYLQWCFANDYDFERRDWIYVPDGRWLRKHTQHAEPGYRYIMTPRATERRDWPDIEARLNADGAVRVDADGESWEQFSARVLADPFYGGDPDRGLTAFAYTPDGRMPQPSELTRRFVQALDAAEAASGPRMVEVPEWLVWSHQHGAWWGPRRIGYTHDLAKAGRYTAMDAAGICERACYAWMRGKCQPGERRVSSMPPEVRILAPDWTPGFVRHADVVAGDVELMERVAKYRVKVATYAALEARDRFAAAGWERSIRNDPSA